MQFIRVSSTLHERNMMRDLNKNKRKNATIKRKYHDNLEPYKGY